MLRGAMRLILALVLGLGLAPATPAAAAGTRLAPEEAQALRAVIEAQLDAFRHDDAERAFSYATDNIHRRYRTAERFMDMVRSEYAVVYRPSTVQFDEPAVLDDVVLQPVRMTDTLGRAWLALYPMVRSADGVWRINGCRLVQLPGKMA